MSAAVDIWYWDTPRHFPASYNDMAIKQSSLSLIDCDIKTLRQRLCFGVVRFGNQQCDMSCHLHCGRLMFHWNCPLNRPKRISERWFPVWGSGKGWPQNEEYLRYQKEKRKAPTQTCYSTVEHRSLVWQRRGLQVVKVRMRGWKEKKKPNCNEEEIKRQEGASQRLSCVGGTPCTTHRFSVKTFLWNDSVIGNLLTSYLSQRLSLALSKSAWGIKQIYLYTNQFHNCFT